MANEIWLVGAAGVTHVCKAFSMGASDFSQVGGDIAMTESSNAPGAFFGSFPGGAAGRYLLQFFAAGSLLTNETRVFDWSGVEVITDSLIESLTQSVNVTRISGQDAIATKAVDFDNLVDVVIAGLPAEVYPNNYVLTQGSFDGGSILDLTTENNNRLNIAPASGGYDWYLEFEIGPDTTPTAVTINGYAENATDVYAYDWEILDWEILNTANTQIPKRSGGDRTYQYSLAARHVNGDSGNGEVRIRFVTITTDTNLEIHIDRASVTAVAAAVAADEVADAIARRTVGSLYVGGRGIYIDTNNGSSGTAVGINGTPDNPCLTLADAVVVAASGSINGNTFYVADLSNIVLDRSFSGTTFDGLRMLWMLDLNGQVLSNVEFDGADVSGSVGVGSGFLIFRECRLNQELTLSPGVELAMYDCYARPDYPDGPTINFSLPTVFTLFKALEWNGSMNIINANINSKVEASGRGSMRVDGSCADTSIITNGTWNIKIEASDITFLAIGSGHFEIDATVTSGTFVLHGFWDVVDNTNGAVTIDYEKMPVDISTVAGVQINGLSDFWGSAPSLSSS